EEIFNAFELCSFSNTKVIILGQDPYHNFNQAHGLAFSVLKGNRIPPSLRNIYNEVRSDLGINTPNHGELTSWAEEGVLLLNTILTVEHNKPLSHKEQGWEIFTDNIIKQINEDNRPKVFVLWGNNAIAKKKLITNRKHLVLTSSHPSPLSARHSFIGSKVFSKINVFLKKTNQEEIDFLIK
ncbi:MAG: uracil-DNA glycosylase, partial [Candidatus Izimaplasma sp.]|nr:uracil-DNA glycosylase [Candidatus Izimaplasma bacterium]